MSLTACPIAAALVTIAASSAAQAGAFVRITAAGHPVRIASLATWNADCVGAPALVEVVVPPTHGTLVGVEQLTTIMRIEAGGGECKGRRIKAEAVIYKPAPESRGTDQFAHTSTTSNGMVLPHHGAVDVR